MEPTTAPKPVKLSPRFGWFKIFRADVARILTHGATDDAKIKPPTIVCIWCALVSIANEQKSTKFNVSVGLIAYQSGVSRRTAVHGLAVLEGKLQMLSRTENKVPGSKQQLEDTYEIHPTGADTPPAKDAAPPCNICTTPPAKDGANYLQGSKRTLSVGERVQRSNTGRKAARSAAQKQQAAPSAVKEGEFRKPALPSAEEMDL